jgi:hypothetical protein
VSLVEVLKKASGAYLSVEGKQHGFTLRPGLTPEELKEFEARLPGELPVEIRELLAFASGLEVDAIGLVDFLGRHPFAFDDAFPDGLPLAGDGEGNFWLQDVREDTGLWDQIFFVSHDPLVVALQAHSLEQFLKQLLNPEDFSYPDALLNVKKNAVDRIWANDPYTIPLEVALSSEDRMISECAEQLEAGFRIADLRVADIGSGFRVKGLKTLVRRCGPSPIFAIKTPCRT